MVEFLEILMPKPRRRLPVTRGECAEGARPCPMVSCRHHLLLEVSRDGRLWAGHDFDEDDATSIADALENMPETCALDVASWGGASQSEVASLLGIDHTRVERAESAAVAKMREPMRVMTAAEQQAAVTYGRRRLEWKRK